jgi:hypothetical protein
MIASTALGIMLVPRLFIVVRGVLKGGHVKRNALRAADPTPDPIRQ